MSCTGGKILVELAYAQGKMLNSESWNGLLARNITPSDIDFFVESCGQFLFGELTKDCHFIENFKRGQELAFRSLSKLPGSHVFAIMQHAVPWNQQIDTKEDIYRVNVYFNLGMKNVIIDNGKWCELVVAWARNPAEANRLLATWEQRVQEEIALGSAALHVTSSQDES